MLQKSNIINELKIMRSKVKDDVVPFRVALMLKRYKFGSNIAARYLGKPRGLVQSWMQAGESHVLAERQFHMGAFEKKLRNIRRKVTKENIYYLLAMKLIDLKLPPEYIGKHLGIPLSTVRSWRAGVSPKGVNRLFTDRNMVDREFKKLMQYLKYESTRQNLYYYLSLKLSENARNTLGRRRIGGKTISKILTKHFNLTRPIPKETVTCWIDGKRRPKNAFEVLKDDEIIEDEYRKIIDELTDEYLEYHIAKALHDRYNWSYSRISKTLGTNKEKVRGWIKKDRGNPMAKCFKNDDKIEEALKKYVIVAPNGGELQGAVREEIENLVENEASFDEDLEDEILYHLSFFPSGLSSPEAIKSILIDNKMADIEDIMEVLENSPKITRKGNRWLLRE
ncbi:MAG: hypothetical protein JSV09_10100 [Thermoplasmata archaeon]|nr:MAG: hypothetical protein JSV09_10100 [Thermoplasmata archaeon]